MDANDIDAAGLIREAYRIEGITPAECRSIFVDWALRLPPGIPPDAAIARLLDIYGTPGHPMDAVLEAGLAPAGSPRRRGGRMARRG